MPLLMKFLVTTKCEVMGIILIKDNIQSAIFEKKINENRFKIASKIEQYNPLQNVVGQINNAESPRKRP